MAKKKQKEKREQFIMVCPKCKSPNVGIDKSNPLQLSIGLPAMYFCKKCDHSGYNFPEVPISELGAFEKESKKEGLVDTRRDNTPKVDASYGAFGVRVLWKITSPMVLGFGIFIFSKEPIYGSILILIGLFLFYITYFKKRKLKED